MHKFRLRKGSKIGDLAAENDKLPAVYLLIKATSQIFWIPMILSF